MGERIGFGHAFSIRRHRNCLPASNTDETVVPCFPSISSGDSIDATRSTRLDLTCEPLPQWTIHFQTAIDPQENEC